MTPLYASAEVSILRAAGDLRDPATRAGVVSQLEQADRQQRAHAEGLAAVRGQPLRGTLPDGGSWALDGFDGERPRYRTTLNAGAAITTAGNLIQSAPYLASGEGGVVGVWDAGAARVTHQEFGGRVTSKDGSSNNDHSTHVAGTICAAGVVPEAKGLAPAARVDSYDWYSDVAEMTSRGASYPGEPGKIYVSNHSYGFNVGWFKTGLSSPAYTWYGTGTNTLGVEGDFGKYAASSESMDALACALPYYLMFWAAGNDRLDNPTAGQRVSLGGATVTYSPASHPAGDGLYRGGYDTLSYQGLAKNVITVGSVKDATNGWLRDVSAAVMNSFPSWGPTDDGRIKPDLVASGHYLKSPIASSDTAYGNYYGTSMASANAAGVAQLLVHAFSRLFTNQAMRASTLKALLIHTADDLGRAGPDYQHGWGLINAKAAADLLLSYGTNACASRVVEDRVAAGRASVSYAFQWDGVSPIRATLCWTDPAGTPADTGDSRVPRLVNNLDLRVIGPDGAVYCPWVMPFVDSWTQASITAPAVTGSNKTDNVEQVLIASPAAGPYRAVVTVAGALADGSQPFSLLLSGAAACSHPPSPAMSAAALGAGAHNDLLSVTGDRFMLGADVRLRRSGARDVAAQSVVALGDVLEARVDPSTLCDGWWHLYVTNPDGQRAVLYNAFLSGTGSVSTVWSESFESGDPAARGWAYGALAGASQWASAAVSDEPPARALATAVAAGVSDTLAAAPEIAVPVAARSVTLAFWHAYSLPALQGGAVLELSVDGGPWFDVAAEGSGASFAAGGYTGEVPAGDAGGGAPLAGRPAWCGDSGGFTKVEVALSDTARFAGHRLRARWRLGSSAEAAGGGWAVDAVALSCVLPPNTARATVVTVR